MFYICKSLYTDRTLQISFPDLAFIHAFPIQVLSCFGRWRLDADDTSRNSCVSGAWPKSLQILATYGADVFGMNVPLVVFFFPSGMAGKSLVGGVDLVVYYFLVWEIIYKDLDGYSFLMFLSELELEWLLYNLYRSL